MAGSEGLNGMKVDNIKLQELEGLFFTVLFVFLGSGRASRVNPRRKLTNGDDRFADLARGCQGQSTWLQNSNPRNFGEFFLDFG